MSKPVYIIGIDLGTTNCTMAYAPIKIEPRQAPDIQSFSIPQFTDPQTIGTSFTLPSFLYFPLEEELSSLKANPKRPFIVGAHARHRGAEIPSRVISSAKSWLCHQGIDRRDKILPQEAEEVSDKMSPLEACSELLRHMREAWDQKMPKTPFNSQQILVTVPASFDPSARQLVQEAAEMAGYPDIVLLEEPQAAFYAWLNSCGEEWRKQLKVGDTVLVIDIGGGTTDFSLISVEEEGGNLSLRRQAVGAHLLLGGDNIDWALAYLARQKLEEQGHAIDSWQLQSLVHRCRQAKEELLSNKAPSQVDVTILGRGSRLIGSTLKTEITSAEIEKVLMEGFLPLVRPEERSPVERRSGIQQVGLPYVQDPRITSQLAKFLSMTGEADTTQMDQFILPTAVLFNGGTMKGDLLRIRILAQLNQWAKALKKPAVKELMGADYDYAVSCGAVTYGLARLGHAIRIKSGTSRSYYVGVEEALPAVPGMSPPLRAVCIVPFGMEEGEERELPGQEFALVVGEQASFRFFSHAVPTLKDGLEPHPGTIIRNWKQELTELNPIEAMLDKMESDGKTIRVKLKAKVTELGFLELWCAAPDGRKWKLEFNIRHPT